jgi:peptidoglycan glycosyltransferase
VFPAASTFVLDQPGLAYSAIGQQDVQSTPLQMALVAAGIANGGTIMTPHVLDRVTNSQNQVVSTYQPKAWLHATSSSTASQLTQLMLSVVNSPNGTGAAARIPGVQVAAKTGTAQTGTNQIDAWFAAFAPAQDPQIAVAVLLPNQPSANEYQGGTLAAPIAKAVIQAYLQSNQPAPVTQSPAP